MNKKYENEVEYRLTKWLLRNLEVQQLLSPDEIRAVWRESIDFYAPPTACLEVIADTIGSDECSLRKKNFLRELWQLLHGQILAHHAEGMVVSRM